MNGLLIIVPLCLLLIIILGSSIGTSQNDVSIEKAVANVLKKRDEEKRKRKDKVKKESKLTQDNIYDNSFVSEYGKFIEKDMKKNF